MRAHKRFLECRFRWPCRTIGSFSRVEIILALQSHASFPRAMRECQILISWQAQNFERNIISRDRRNTFEPFMQISWQARHFRAIRADFVAGAALSSLRADFVAGAAL